MTRHDIDESLSLDAVRARFDDSASALSELHTRLERLASVEEQTERNAEALDVATKRVATLADELRGSVDLVQEAQTALIVAMESVQRFLVAAEASALHTRIDALEAELRRVADELGDQIDEVSEQIEDVETARIAQETAEARLRDVAAHLPGKARRKLGIDDVYD